MPDPNPQHAPTDHPLSRRALLGATGAALAAAFLTGCESTPTKSVMAVGDLPDPDFVPQPGMSLVPDTTPYTPPSIKVPPRPVTAFPTNPWGIIPRSVWATKGPNLQRVDPMNGINLITFHHSGDPKPFVTNDAAGTAQHLENVRHWHRDQLGWQDIGYHFAIDRAGRIWQLRPLAYAGQHVRGKNDHNIGVVVLGNFELQAPTAQQLQKVQWFSQLLRKQYRLAPNRVFTHRELVKTTCPGKNMQPLMTQYRKQGKC